MKSQNHRLLNKQGFTLLEILIAAMISGLVMLSAVGLMSSMGSGEKASEQTASQVETVVSLGQLRDTMLNIVRYQPPHDLLASQDGLMSGVSDVNSGLNNNCTVNLDPSQDVKSVVVFNRIQPTARPAKLLKFWEENKIEDSDANTRRLFISKQGTFDPNSPPQEVIVVDADGLQKRAYFVDQITDVPANSPSNPVAEAHLEVELRLLKAVGNGWPTSEKKTLSFVTGSLVFPSQTDVICVSQSSGRLVRTQLKPLTAGTASWEELLGNEFSKFTLKSFKVSFLGTKNEAGFRLDPREFYVNLPTAAGENNPWADRHKRRVCANVVQLGLVLEGAPLKAGGEKLKVTHNRTIFINNLMQDRPVSCQ